LPLLSLAEDFEWGEISDEELLMPGIEEDPEADAVILFNRSRIQINEDFDLEVYYHKRIKILTEAGKEYANVEIPYWHEDRIYQLDAVCYTPDGEKHELDGDNVYEEGSELWKKKVFAIPAVEVGSVIEYKYELYSDYIYRLEPWSFQEHDFTKYSEIMVMLPAGFTYSALPINIPETQIEKNSEDVRDPYNFNKKCTRFTWVVRDLPGIKKEPYMTAFHDYYAQVLFQLVSYKSPYRHFTFAKTWDNVAESEWTELDNWIDQDGGIEDFTRELVNGLSKPREKAEKIYDYIRREIRTTGTNRLGGSKFKEPKKVFKEKEGSTNEKNILLINMLNKAGIEANPLYVSTRDHGGVATGWVAIQQFNRIIAMVKMGKKTMYLNCGHKYCPMGYLTPEYDVTHGFLINEKKGKIIGLETPSPRNRCEIETEANLDESGNLAAHSRIEYKGINGIIERDRIEDKDLNDFLANKLKEIHSETVLDSFTYVVMDSCKKPLILEIDFHIPEFIEDAGSLVYFKMPLFTGHSKNVFVREKRNFPVDFDY
ncbi:MAG: DUF3857 domain-containing protein, partial [Calditrichaceae bacterium]